MQFRDIGVDFERARALELRIAQRLVQAPTVPVDIVAFDLRLLSVMVDGSGVGLSVGRAKPVATLYYRAPTSDGALPEIEVWPGNTGWVDLEDRTRLERMRRRLLNARGHVDWQEVWGLVGQLSSLPTQIPLTHFRQVVDGVTPATGLIRTGFRCNQDCGFCWQGRSWPKFDSSQILAWIEDLHAAGVQRLIMSGGEPTLDRDLFSYLDAAARFDMEVTLETNAIQMAKPGFAQRLAAASPGLKAFVSFHSADAGASDTATRAPGTHERTVKGIKALLDAGVTVKLNAVITSHNVETLAELPGFIHRELQARPGFRGLMISLPQTPFDESLDRELRASPEQVRTHLPATIRKAREYGIELDGLNGPCGPPLCLLGDELAAIAVAPIPHEVDFRSYLPACEECSVRKRCFGVHRSDLEVFGERCASALP